MYILLKYENLPGGYLVPISTPVTAYARASNARQHPHIPSTVGKHTKTICRSPDHQHQLPDGLWVFADALCALSSCLELITCCYTPEVRL